MTPPDPAPRLGPRPLSLHLAAALAVWPGSKPALALSRSGSLPWRPELAERAEQLRPLLATADPAGLASAVDREARRRLDRFLTGVARYRGHVYRRAMPPVPAIWAEGDARLLDFGSLGAGGDGGLPLLLVPSLINRGYILDLAPGRSFARWLAARGVRPLLLDWGRPGPRERRFTLDDYVSGCLARALQAAVAAAGGPVVVAGYCMGGLLATALAGLHPEQIAGLLLMATPWDFHAEDAGAARRAAAALPLAEPLLAALDEMPTDVLQTLFAMLDPALALRKFVRFAALDPDGDEAHAFVALEDWLNDGVPLAAPVARECLGGWYGRNEPARGEWRVGGRPVRPEALRLPVLALVPARDRIVPPASARALAEAIPGAELLAPPLGHIGMMASASAGTLAWEPILAWLGGIGASRQTALRGTGKGIPG
ncbi:alpha/beta fold hydrolase [Arenibaculum pallidiluteum]|uniref:alpha/beta fold hydrolase n=1 Tax=Arenibaculum pallidiluteum TaxID=2812559 RepID=UPI001A977322|nr:alpha/beta fold hydrolase [Arenibaculum pallidiluteum]